jgi:hypothetical protein
MDGPRLDPDRLNREIRQALGAWGYLGVDLTPSGSAYWGRPRPAEGMGFLHRLFAPISLQSYEEITDFNPLFKNFSYPHLLVQMNGMNAYRDTFYLFGAHHKQKSGLDMPYNILNTNREAWGILSSQDQLVIGGGNLGNRTDNYVQRSDGSVFAAGGLMTPLEGVINYEWPDLETFCTSELARLALCFDTNGDCICDLEPMPHCGGKEVA